MQSFYLVFVVLRKVKENVVNLYTRNQKPYSILKGTTEVNRRKGPIALFTILLSKVNYCIKLSAAFATYIYIQCFFNEVHSWFIKQ